MTDIISKSEMKRVATVDPQKAADELMKLRQRVAELEKENADLKAQIEAIFRAENGG